jgi:hypothetical protein
MELPWGEDKKERIEELEEELEEVNEERQRLKEQLEAEKERRSKLSTAKQEAEKEKKKLKNKLRNLKEEKKETDSAEESSWRKLEFEQAQRILEKISSVESSEKDLVTVKSPGKASELPDLKGLKNSLNSESFSKIKDESSFIGFLDDDFLDVVIKTRPFMDADWELAEAFRSEEVLDFIDSEKHWVLVSSDRTRIFKEESGNFSELENFSTRVDRKQKKGGFSQSRFERKREEQIQEHVEKTEEKLEDLENVKLLGEKSLCEKVPGEHLGGFDSSKPAGPDMFYSFRLKQF